MPFIQTLTERQLFGAEFGVVTDSNGPNADRASAFEAIEGSSMLMTGVSRTRGSVVLH
jgi:hypothetical protein